MNTTHVIAIITTMCMIITIPSVGAWAQEDRMMSDIETVQIGGLFPLTGETSSIGEQLRVAAELAVEDLNAYLAEQDVRWQVELVVEDTGAGPVQALEKIQSLHVRGISLVVGPAASGATSHVKGYANSNDMLLIGCCSTSPDLVIAGDSAYRLISDDSNEGTTIAAMLHADGITGLVPIWRGETYGDELRNAAAEAFEGYGGQVHAGVRYAPETPGYGLEVALLNEYVKAMVDIHGIDKVAVFMVSFDEGQLIMRSAYIFQTLKQVKWYGGEALAQVDYLLEDDITSKFIAGVDFTAIQILDSPGRETDELRERITAITGSEPTSFVRPSYDSIWLLGKAMLAAHSTEAGDIKDVLPDVASEYSGAMSSTELNAADDLKLINYQIWKVVDNNWEKGGIYAAEQGILTAAMQPEDEVLIGSLYPLTDGQNPTGHIIPVAVQLGLDHFNEFLDSLNIRWNMNIISEDTESNPDTALARVMELNDRGVNIIIGPPTSASVSKVKPYSDENNMMLISCCSTAPSLAIADDSVFRLAPDDSKQGIAIGKLLADEGIKVVVPVWRGDVYGDDLHDTAKANFESRGHVFAEGIRYDTSQIEFDDTAASLDAAVQDSIARHGSDNVAIFLIAFDESVQVLQSASNFETLKNAKWFVSETLTKQGIVLDDPITRDFIANTEYAGMQVAESGGTIHDMIEAYFVERNGSPPTTFVYHAYDVVWLVGLSILQSGSTDVDIIKSILPEVASRYMGAIGGTTLNDAGDLAAVDYTVWSVIDGKWTAIGSYSLLDDTLTITHAGMAFGSN